MDRHQFVEKLTGMHEELAKELKKCQDTETAAYKRSATHLRALLKEPESSSSVGSRTGSRISGMVASLYDVTNVCSAHTDPVDDEAIIDMCHQVADLRERIQLSKDTASKHVRDAIDLTSFVKERKDG